MNIAKQLTFDFSDFNKKDNFLSKDFLNLPCNKSAVDFIKIFFAQNSNSKNRIQSCILKGDHASGKTHLLNICANSLEGGNYFFIKKQELNSINFSHFFCDKIFYILENIQEIESEELLLRIINCASEAGAFLVLSESQNIFRSLKDLQSRLQNIFIAEIKNPNQSELEILLTHHFSLRQLKIDSATFAFIASNVEPSYKKIYDLVRMIDFYCSENKKTISIAEVKKIISNNF